MITIILNHHNKYAEVDMPAMYEELQLALWKLGLDRVPEKYTLQDLEATFRYQSPLEYFVLRLLEGEMNLLDAVSAIYTVIAPPRPIMAQVQILSSGFRSITELRQEIDRMIKSSAQFGSTCFFPVRGWLVGLDGEMEPARNAVMLQNAEVIGEAVQRMQSWIIHDMALCFADTETDAEESLFQKILSARWSVEKRGRKLYGRIDLLLTEDLTPEEQEALEEKTRRITTQDMALRLDRWSVLTDKGILYINFGTGREKVFDMHDDIVDDDESNCSEGCLCPECEARLKKYGNISAEDISDVEWLDFLVVGDHTLAREIFRQDHLCIYQKQTQYRDQLREQGRESVEEIVAQINSGTYSNSKVESLLVSLSDRLSRTSGKKVYGYLKADVKAIVDEIVVELAEDERIRKLYDLWYEQREDVLRTYTDHFPERIPLEQNKEFKTIRNAVIQEAMKIVNGIQQAAELEPQQDVWDVGLPPGGEPDMDTMADPGYWMEQFQPRFMGEEPVASEQYPVDMEPEDASTLRSSDSKEWCSDYYKLARKYLYGTGTENPDFQKAMPLLLMEANRGNGYACYDLGRMYLLGQGCEEDVEEAQRWFRDALEAFQMAEAAAEKKGYLRYRIGKCHAYGHGTDQNYEESAKWFRQAVDEHNPFAAYTLGGQHLRGQGVEQSDAEAYGLYHMAATHEKQPNAYAQYQLGKMYRDGIGTEVDIEESSLRYAKAYAGFLDMEETMADDKLYYRLGSMNMTGTGTAVDLEQARYYFEKAAELGNADALYGLGKLYLKTEFPDYDPHKAVEYLEQAAAKGNAFAKYQLGKLLCQGELVEKDIPRGLPLLEKLAEAGVTFAFYIAGKVYLREEGWQDIKKAILYFRQAAEDGNSFAEYQLGRIYYFGNGVRADREKGLEYLKDAASHGNEYAANLLQTIQQQHTWGVASCTASLIAQLGRIFQEQDQKQNQRQRPRMDRKHRREIEEKKQAMGIRD